MALVFKPRENLMIERRTDLEQSIINNLSIFFDLLGTTLIYEIKQVFSITLKDGTVQRAGSVKVKTGTTSSGQTKYKTVNNKFAVVDIYLQLEGLGRKKLTRLLLGSVNATEYNPTKEDLEKEAENIKNLIKQGQISGIGEQVEVKPIELKRGIYNIVTTREGRIQSGPFPSQNMAQDWQDKTLKAYQRKGRNYSAIALETDNPGLPIFERIDDFGNTIFARQVETAPLVTTASANMGKPGANALTLLEWFQAQGKPLPSVSERASLFEELGLGSAGTYIATGEQNVALLNALKLK